MAKLSKSDAVAVITGRMPDCSSAEINRAWQSLLDSGEVWSLGRWWVDMAGALIERGDIRR